MSAQRQHGLTTHSKERNNSARQQNQCYKLQSVPEKTFPILKEVFLTLTPRQRPFKIFVFVANITNELSWDWASCSHMIHLAIYEVKRCLAEEKVLLWRPSIPALWLHNARSGDGSTGKPLQSGKWHCRTESGGPTARKALHSHDTNPTLTKGTRQGPECQPSQPEAKERTTPENTE